jgi:flagellar biogenesis protein FliO
MPQATRTVVWIAVLSLAVLCAPESLNGQPADALPDRFPSEGRSAPAGPERIGRSSGEADRAVWEPRGPQEGHPGAVTQTGLDRASDPPPAPPGRTDSIPLAPPGRTPERGKDATRPAGRLDISTVITVGSSLALVLGLFLVVAWIMRRTTPGACPVLTSEVFEVLGRAPLAARQQAYLVRLGRKLVLLSISPAGIETLSEVTDPDEVNRLAGLCQRARPDSATAAFRQVFQQFSKDHPADRPIEPAGGRPFQGVKGASRGTGGRSEGSDV